MATTILAEYAADQPAILAEAVFEAEPRSFQVLYAKLATHGAKAASLLEEEIARQASPTWNDAKLDPTWQPVPAGVVQAIQSAHGLVADRFALCQDMPLEEFSKIADGVRSSGYRPVRLRPFTFSGSVHVAAVWTRDDRDWRIAQGMAADEIRAQDEKYRGEGFMPVDVAGYVQGEGDEAVEHYAGVWLKRTGEEDARLYVDASYAAHKAAYQPLEQAGFARQHSLQTFRGLDGQQKYCGVKSKGTESSPFSSNQPLEDYEQTEYLDRVLWDISLSSAPSQQSPEDRHRKSLAAAENRLKTSPADLAGRYYRAMANYYLGNNQEALADFESLNQNAVLSSGETLPSVVLRYRAMLHARLGDADKAKEELAKFQELSQSESHRAYAAAVVAAELGEDVEGMKQLEAVVKDHATDGGFLYDAACAYSMASQAIAEKEAVRSKSYADRAVVLLKQATAQGYNDYSHMETDLDLDPIRDRPGFQEVLQAGQLDRRYAAVWDTSRSHESAESHGLGPEEHLRRCRELATAGYRPVAIAVGAFGKEQSLVTASVWHWPVVTEDAKEALARRQASAAVALLRMGEEEEVWPLLKHTADPRVRSWIIHRLCPMGADVKAIVERLREDRGDVSIRRALILTLGEYEDLAPADREALVGTLLDMYRDNPDPGIHGAAEWLLRKWNQLELLVEIDKPLATGDRMDARQWYFNGQGQAMTVIPGPVEFRMGSPATEPDRYSYETPHRRKIARSFAIATKEVTIEQFQEFLRANPGIRHNYTKRFAPAPKCPQTAVTWYEAAAYCR